MAQFEMSIANNRQVRRVLEKEPNNRENQIQSEIGGQKREEKFGESFPVLVKDNENKIEESRDRLMASKVSMLSFLSDADLLNSEFISLFRSDLS